MPKEISGTVFPSRHNNRMLVHFGSGIGFDFFFLGVFILTSSTLEFGVISFGLRFKFEIYYFSFWTLVLFVLGSYLDFEI